LYDVLAGVSPDYAIVAQPNSDTQQPDPLAQAFSVKHGVSLYDLASRYDQELKAVFNTQLQALLAAHGRADEPQAVARQSAQRSEQLAAELGAVYASQSWRITRPLRWLARRIRSLRKDA
jgi:O-antigen chain-terminating methyltransferase